MSAPLTRWVWAAWALALPGPALSLLGVARGASTLKPLGDPAAVLLFCAVVLTAASVASAIAALWSTRGGARRGRALAIAALVAALAGGAATFLAGVLSGMPHLG